MLQKRAVPLTAALATSLAALAGALALPSVASAQQKPAQQAEPDLSGDDSESDPGPARPAAPDQRTGHLYIDGKVAVSGLTGSVDTDVAAKTLAGTGLTTGGTLGIGISRYVVLQAFGEATFFSSPGGCNIGCSGKSWAAGLGLRFHPVQGLAFDPWGSFGVGYRYATFRAQDPSADIDFSHPTASDFKTQVFQGIDIARLSFGGDFYPTPVFGFGAFVEGDFGTFLSRAKPLLMLPADATSVPTPYALFQAGVRITFDPFRTRRELSKPQVGLSRGAGRGEPE